MRNGHSIDFDAVDGAAVHHGRSKTVRRRAPAGGPVWMVGSHTGIDVTGKTAKARKKVIRWLRIKKLSEVYFKNLTCQVLMLALTMAACVMFVAETYLPNDGLKDPTVLVLELVFSSGFLVDYILTIAFAIDRWSYIFSFQGVVDLMSSAPMLYLLGHHFRDHDPAVQPPFQLMLIVEICRVLRTLKMFRIMRLSDTNLDKNATGQRSSLFWDADSVHTQAVKLIVWLAACIFIITGLVWTVENHNRRVDAFKMPDEPLDRMPWHEAFYFVCVTLATIGYGDIVPKTTVARLVIVGCIFFFLTAIPYQIGKLMEALSDTSRYDRDRFCAVRGTQHAVVIGQLTYNILGRFVWQFLHGDHCAEHHFRLVILATHMPEPRVKSLLMHPRYKDRIHYLKGSPYSASDLQRAGVHVAKAVFILADFDAPDIGLDQDRILLTAVSVRKFVVREASHLMPLSGRRGGGVFEGQALPPSLMPNTARKRRVRLMERRSNVAFESKAFMTHDASEGDDQDGGMQDPYDVASDYVVMQTHTSHSLEELIVGLGFRWTYCPHMLRLRLMAYATVYPGFFSLFINLLKDTHDGAHQLPEQPQWYQMMVRGAMQKIVRLELSAEQTNRLRYRTFADVCRWVYVHTRLVLVGVECDGVVLMNPHTLYRFESMEAVVYCIALSDKHAHNAFDGLMRTATDTNSTGPPSVPLDPSRMPPRRTHLMSHACHVTPTAHTTAHTTDTATDDVYPRVSGAPQHDMALHRKRAPDRAGVHSAPSSPTIGRGSNRRRSMELPMMPFGATHINETRWETCASVRHVADHGHVLREARKILQQAHDEHHDHTDPQAQLRDAVTKKVHEVRELLTQLLETSQMSPPAEGLTGHVIVALCHPNSKSVDALTQFVGALRRLVHVPIVILGNSTDQYWELVQRLRRRLSQSRRCRSAPWVKRPDATHIYFVKGSPQSRVDLERCGVERAYGVVLLGDDPMERAQPHPCTSCGRSSTAEAGSGGSSAGGDGARGSSNAAYDVVAKDRHVLLPCFKVERILRGADLYEKVMTLVDLHSDENVYLLRQNVRRGGSLHPPPTSPSVGSSSSSSSAMWPETSETEAGNGGHQAPVRQESAWPITLQPYAAMTPSGPVNSRRWKGPLAGAASSSAFSSSSSPSSNSHSMPGEGSPIFAAGRVCFRSFFDVLFIYFYSTPTALRFWKELIRSQLDHVDNDEFEWAHKATCLSATTSTANVPAPPITTAARDLQHDTTEGSGLPPSTPPPRDTGYLPLGRSAVSEGLRSGARTPRKDMDPAFLPRSPLRNATDASTRHFGGCRSRSVSLDLHGLSPSQERDVGGSGNSEPMGSAAEPVRSSKGFAAGASGLEDQDSIDAVRSTLDQVLVASELVGRPYGDLVDSFMAMGWVPIGLYRPSGTCGASLPYSVVSPHPDSTIIAEGDAVFVLRPEAHHGQGQ